MSERMTPIPFKELMNWILREKRETGSVFGIRQFYKADPNKYLELFGEKMETIFGPAAGPNTQLAQNIVASYCGGSRFFELKTCQILDGDDLAKCIARPCILAEDECYNCEWSTELYVPQALAEYIKGWYALKLISKEWGLGDPNGFIFNMSVGYDLKGIQSEKIDNYLNCMNYAKDTDAWKECEKWALENIHRFENIDEDYIKNINPQVSRSVTISTLHGCPPSEIEAIATHLINTKKINTFIKCNPTLLKYEEARKIMDDRGFDYVAFGDFHFKDDLQFEDAIPMLQRLQALCDKNNLQFGVKITNTFPVDVKNNELPSEEMYMAGRSLFNLSSKVALNLSRAFKGKLRISYSGGADHFNMVDFYKAGIWPVTVATTILKPGGYERLVQIAHDFDNIKYKPFECVDIAKLDQMHTNAATDPHYTKKIKPALTRKNGKKVPLIDCYFAPCEHGCPINQDIPTYVHLEGEGKYKEALKVILDKNPLPFMTGNICNHRCQSRCTRTFYEENVLIRDSKLIAARAAYDEILKELKVTGDEKNIKVAIIGGGPAGIAAAHFLAREGAKATIFEKRDSLGGVVKHMIPDFRLSDNEIDKDAKMLEKLGVEIKLNTEITDLSTLKNEYDKIILAIGAHNHGSPAIKEGDSENSLDFLERAKKDLRSLSNECGEAVAVIGAGNTAMDVARVAKRVPGVKDVYLIYRRTARYMPADEEELELALHDGVELKELLSPISYVDGKLKCEKMILGEPDSSGRRNPTPTGEFEYFEVGKVVTAVGEQIDPTIFINNDIPTDEKGHAIINKLTFESKVPGIYVIGDGALGAATIVQAIADATKAVNSILNLAPREALHLDHDRSDVLYKRAKLQHSCDNCEKERCIECNVVCESCVDVCPNRANVNVYMDGHKTNQVIHIDYMCNECGNCAIFCPWQSAPYKDKFTVFTSLEDFKDSTNEGFLMTDYENGKFLLRLEGKESEHNFNDTSINKDILKLVKTINENYSYLLLR